MKVTVDVAVIQVINLFDDSQISVEKLLQGNGKKVHVDVSEKVYRLIWLYVENLSVDIRWAVATVKVAVSMHRLTVRVVKDTVC